MSTILDALKKVERERESTRDQLLHAPPAEPAGGRRIPATMIVVCAALGFAAGAVIALWRGEPVPEPGPPTVPAAPAIDVPPAAAPAQRLAARDVADEPPPTVVDAAPRPRAAGADAPPLAPQVAPPAPVEDEPDAPAAEPVEPAPAVVAPAADESAIEPSAFLPAREDPGAAAEQVAAVAPPAAAPDREDAPVAVAARPEGDPEQQLAAIAPPVAPAPEPDIVEDESAAEPEPNVIDTGRSPPGAPSVGLSFLQWSVEPARRFAFITVDGGDRQRVREGDVASGVTVDRIMPGGIQLRHNTTSFIVRPRH